MNLLDKDKNEMNYILNNLEKIISCQKDESFKEKYEILKNNYYSQRENERTLSNLTKTYISTGLFLITIAASLFVEGGTDTISLQIILSSVGIIPLISSKDTISLYKENKIKLKETIEDIRTLEKDLSKTNEKVSQVAESKTKKYSYNYKFTEKKEELNNQTIVKTKRKQ